MGKLLLHLKNQFLLEKPGVVRVSARSSKFSRRWAKNPKYGPDSYVLGVSEGLKMAYQNPEHGEESERIHNWLKQYRYASGTYKTGDLRDVYPFNVLCQVHLDREVNGQRFEEWVTASPERGQLKKVTDTLWTWWVEADHIPAVREALAPSGMILCL